MPTMESLSMTSEKRPPAEPVNEHGGYCCSPKQYIMDNNDFTNCLDIVPRVILIKKQNFKLNEKFEKNVKIKNLGRHDRKIDFGTDSDDTTVIMEKNIRYRYIEPAEVFNIKVNVRPVKKATKNQRRHIYIYLMHPNVVFELPIIILGSIEEPLPSLPDQLIFRPTNPNNLTAYEFIIYNPWNENIMTKVLTSSKKIKLVINDKMTPKNNFIKIVVFICVTTLEEVTDVLKVKFGKAAVLEISITHTPIPIDCHLSVSHLNFEELKFGRTATKQFLICNDSEQPAKFELYLLAEDEREGDELALSIENEENDDISIVSLDYPKPNTMRRIPSDSSSSTNSLDSQENRKVEKSSSSLLTFFASASKHFSVEKLENYELPANSTQEVTVTFQPTQPNNEEFSGPPPYLLRTKIVLISSYLDYKDVKFIIVTGAIRSPEIEITPDNIELRRIFLGEEHCVSVDVINHDEIANAKVFFRGYDQQDKINLTINPKNGCELGPLERCKFHLSIFAKVIGKILFKLSFQLQNGPRFNVIIRGTSQTLALRTFPNLLNYGNIPIAVPQKRYLLIMNPCSVPVTAQIVPTEDGEETPLVLKVDDITEPLPITVKDPIHIFNQAQADEVSSVASSSENIICFEDGTCTTKRMREEQAELSDDSEITVMPEDSIKSESGITDSSLSQLKLAEKPSAITFHSVEAESEYSMEFIMEVIEPMYDLAATVLANIKKKRILEKNEIEKRTIAEALKALLSQKYFNKMDLYKNYAFFDWNALPSDPKEIYCDNDVLYLLPNTGKKITCLLIPNKVGVYHRSLTVRVCPIHKYRDCDGFDTGYYQRLFAGELIASEVMTSLVMLEYHCMVPSFIWENEITFKDVDVYANQSYDFVMTFQNDSLAGGFVFYEVVPNCEDGYMSFNDNIWKLYVEPSSTGFVNCSVVFCKTGNIKLYGLIRFLGNCCPSVFTITAHVQSTKLNGVPDSIEHWQRVCEKKRYYIYLENATPTVSTIEFSLEKESKKLYVHPHGYQLGPNKQGMYLTICSFFKDPGRYQNTLYIQVGCSKRLEVPIIINVEGTPIYFEPPIKDGGFDMGHIYIVTECEFINDEPKHISELIIKNCGNRQYHITITKTKSNVGALCALGSTTARIDIFPKNFTIEPNCEMALDVTGIAYEEQTIQNEFRLQLVDITKPTRFENVRLPVKANFITPKILWKPAKLNLIYERTHIFKEHPVQETIEIINVEEASIELVRLKCMGPFKVKELFEDPYEKEISFSLAPSEHKELTIVVHKESVKNAKCHKFEGRISCMAYNIPQKSFKVSVSVLTPQVAVLPKELVLFANKEESQTVIEVQNVGCVDAEYKWKKLSENLIYVEQEDDEKEFIRDILSDILHMLEISESIPDEYPNENLSERYRRYRCQLQRLEDEIGIKTIIDEIIDNLDLEHKRYIIHWDDDEQINEYFSYMLDDFLYDICEEAVQEESSCNVCVQSCPSPVPSSMKIPNDMLNEILRKLKIEDSYDITEPSSSECSAERFAYFYKKWAIVKVNHKDVCLIHLPGVRKGYELRVSFELEVIGGESQFFTLVLVNLKKTVELSRHHVYLGIRPWYELYKANVRATNVTPYIVNVIVNQLELDKHRQRNRLIDGYLQLKTDKLFEINEHGNKMIKTDSVMGLRYVFSRELQVIINGGDEMRIKFSGQGVMPIFSMVSKLPHVLQEDYQIHEDYLILKRMFYFDIFRQYTEFDEESSFVCEEEECGGRNLKAKKVDLSDLTETKSDISEQDMELEAESFDNFSPILHHERKWKNLLDTYVMVQYQDVPNALVLQQVLETEKFVIRLENSSDTRELLAMVYREHVKVESTRDDQMPLNLKHFAIQPLPFEMHGFTLNMNVLKMGQFRKFEFTLQFFGPGKLIAQVRTAVHIPGMFVSLYTEKAPSNVTFTYYKPEQKMADTFVKPYRNMWERIMDAEKDPKLKHAHSFDIDRRHEHMRDEISLADRKNILSYYNSLNKSVYMEHKHHYILNKVYAKTKQNFSGTLLHVVVLIKPEAKYFKHNQFIEDIMYIDLHMGPMLPITLHAQVKSN